MKVNNDNTAAITQALNTFKNTYYIKAEQPVFIGRDGVVDMDGYPLSDTAKLTPESIREIQAVLGSKVMVMEMSN